MIWLLISIVLWGVIHSLLASVKAKDSFRQTLGDGFMRFYRLLYNFFSVVSFLPILYLTVALPDTTLYQIPAPYDLIMRMGQVIAVVLLVVAILQTDLLSFAGLRQLVEEEKTGPLMTGGLYRYVRHPLYTFGLLILWLSPAMSLNSFILYLALTIYILVGIVFEERKLIREFGQDYIRYRSGTPMLIPGIRFNWNK